jgi:hypothetical protein
MLFFVGFFHAGAFRRNIDQVFFGSIYGTLFKIKKLRWDRAQSSEWLKVVHICMRNGILIYNEYNLTFAILSWKGKLLPYITLQLISSKFPTKIFLIFSLA